MTGILAIASGGGHWDELMLLRSAFDGRDVVYATTNSQLSVRDGISHVEVLPDCNRDQVMNSLHCLWASLRLVWRLRPRVVVTTGALPGLFCLIAARLLGARTVWVDSIANSDEPSLSGRVARPFTSLWLTQWPHLADGKAMLYRGALL
ncbi:MAG TPA: hypothetical protein EYH41_15395 [Novosphingobium capsulatum]|uniref:Glucuronosyltransferase n=2 Tax=Novosphingobium pituita TaxID=3056842 RepID=A0ABQ6PAH6_9SPHN|nr:hypothetical protein NUTIK01_26890 [Novosphingobium sp. IK01]HIQ19339.1 hypothetical protein [Novosphingobium capsulatum]